ncbi:MAG: class I SAM-dependent methyltransferase [Candidatus Brocadiales bacterium]|nr:class I SAM-dependent methyltransferase [Candidatus Brocadiales bacterium]
MSKTPEHLGGHLNKTHTDFKTLEYLMGRYNIKSMIDVGCGPGDMIKIAQNVGIDACGIDGDFNLKRGWEEREVEGLCHDFATGSPKIDEEFDLAWSVEFLEHVDEEYQESYMSVFRKCNYVICTAAPPGAPGHHHVNCRDRDYWIDVFDKNGFDYDEIDTEFIRANSGMVKPFIQRNGFLFKKRK